MIFSNGEVEIFDAILAELEDGIRTKAEKRFPGTNVEELILFVGDTRRVLDQARSKATEAFDTITRPRSI